MLASLLLAGAGALMTPTSPPPLTRDFARSIGTLQHRFLADLDPVRPELYRYCRALTRDAWEAEDLVQETLLKAFAKLGEVHWELKNPRGYLFRIATHCFIDGQRKRRPEVLHQEPAASSPPADPQVVREALAELAGALPPRERTAVLLKDVFGFTLEEVANIQRVSVGAVKAALHRGRGKLASKRERPEASPTASEVSPSLLDAFVAAFNSRDLDALIGLFQEDAEAEVVGMVLEYGAEQIKSGSLPHTLEDGSPTAERVSVGGRDVVLLWYEEGGRAVQDVLTFVEVEGKVAAMRYYYFCPELLEEVVGQELKLPQRGNGYRYRTGD